MGSIGTYREKGQTDLAFFQDLYPSFKFHALTRVSGVVYAACSKPEGADPDEVFALVCPVSSYRGEFIVKEQDETMGPYDVKCPVRILDLLTETDSEYANEWRARCRAYQAAAKTARERARRIVAGTIIKLPSPAYFGKQHGFFDTFRYSGKGNGFTALDASGLPALFVSLGGGWKMTDYEEVQVKNT